MAGIDDLIELYRGERHTTLGGLDEARRISSSPKNTFGRWFTTNKDLAEAYSRSDLTKNYKRKLKKVNISKKDLEFAKKLKSKLYKAPLEFMDESIVLLPKKNLKNVKVIESNLVKDNLDIKKGKVKLSAKNLKENLLKTFTSNVKSLTPLALKGLNFMASLPVATLTMVLQSTPANADEANMQLEDFAKLHEGSTNVDKALPSQPMDI